MSKLPDPNPIVYRMYDGAGRLLYIGTSIRLRNRLSTHRTQSWFWDLVERITTEQHPTEAEARAAEAAAIRSEQPPFNGDLTGRKEYALTEDDIRACRKWLDAVDYRSCVSLPRPLWWIADLPATS